MAAYYSGVNFRCCEEEDVPDICQLINNSTVGDKHQSALVLYGLNPDQIEDEASNGQVQWYALEADSMDELLLAVARFHISSEDNQGSVGTVSKLFFAQQEACKEHITQYLMRNMIHQFKRIVFHLNLSLLTIEVPQFDEALQALLEQEGFTETGGYLAEHIGMMFKFSVRMEGDDKGLLHVLPAPSDLNEATPFPQSDVVVNMEEEEDNNQDEDDVDNLDTLLDSLDVNQVENLKQEENMTNLIDSLFTALHRHDIQPEST